MQSCKVSNIQPKPTFPLHLPYCSKLTTMDLKISASLLPNTPSAFPLLCLRMYVCVNVHMPWCWRQNIWSHGASWILSMRSTLSYPLSCPLLLAVFFFVVLVFPPPSFIAQTQSASTIQFEKLLHPSLSPPLIPHDKIWITSLDYIEHFINLPSFLSNQYIWDLFLLTVPSTI